MTTENSHPAVAVLGTGTMGAPIARNLRKAGFAVMGWNRSPAKAEALADDGVTVATTPADAVTGAGIVVTVLKDADAVIDVLTDAGDSLAPGTVLIQISTVGVEGIGRVEHFATDHDLRLVDAPVQGTKGPAENAQLVVLASGSEAVRELVDPLLDAIGKKTLWISTTVGEASKLKVVVNSFISALTHGIAEAVRLAEALDVKVEDLQQALQGGPLDAPFGSIKLDAIAHREFAPSFTVDNAIKDSRLVAEAADHAGVWLPVADAGLRRYVAAAEAGHADEDMAASYFAEATNKEGDHAS